MTNRMTMALMAAALILAMQGHPRAQSPDCPCGNPADLVPVAKWPTDIADCSADPTRTALYGFSFEGAGLVFCPPAEHRELMSGLAIPFSMWQCAGHGDAAGPGFVR